MNNFLANLTRTSKKQIFLTLDALIVAASIAIAFALHSGSWASTFGTAHNYTPLGVFLLCAPIIIFACGLHRIKLGAYESAAIEQRVVDCFWPPRWQP